LSLASAWPSLLSGGYRMKRALPALRALFARRAPRASLNG
jgi:hypothetical protein